MELSLGQRTSLIHDYRLRMRERLQIVAALYQDAVFGRTADTAEKAQRHRDDQRTWAGDNEERQRTIDPAGERLPRNERRQHCQNYSGNDHAGRIEPGKLSDKLLRLCLAGGGFFHQLHDFGGSGFRRRLGNDQFHRTGQIHTAAANRIAHTGCHRHGFACQRSGVDGGVSLKDLRIQRDLFAGAHQNVFAHFHFVHQHRFRLAVPEYCRLIRAEIQQIGHCLAGTSYGDLLEKLTHLVEQDDFHRLRILPDGKRRNGGDRHQKILIKHLPVRNVPHSLFQHTESRHQIHCQEDQQLCPPEQRQQMGDCHCHGKQYRTNDDLDQNFTLLFCHTDRLLLLVSCEPV